MLTILMNKEHFWPATPFKTSTTLIIIKSSGYPQGLQLSPPFAEKIYQWIEKFCALLLKSSGNLKYHLLITKSR